MKNIIIIISIIYLSFNSFKANALTSQVVETCVSSSNLDWYVEVISVGNNNYELVNYKLVAKSDWHGNEQYERVYSRVANVTQFAINDYTVYGGEEFGPLKLKIDAPVGAKGSILKATLYILQPKMEDYQSYSFLCSRY